MEVMNKDARGENVHGILQVTLSTVCLRSTASITRRQHANANPSVGQSLSLVDYTLLQKKLKFSKVAFLLEMIVCQWTLGHTSLLQCSWDQIAKNPILKWGLLQVTLRTIRQNL